MKKLILITTSIEAINDFRARNYKNLEPNERFILEKRNLKDLKTFYLYITDEISD